MMTPLSEIELKQRLIQKRKIVKQKLNFLKHGEMIKEEMFSPITKHLKGIESTLGNTIKKNSNNFESQIKNEPLEYGTNQVDDASFSQNLPTPLFQHLQTPKYMKSTPSASKIRVPKNIFKQLIRSEGGVNLTQNEDEDPSESKISIVKSINNSESEDITSPPNQNRFEDLAEFSFVDYLDQYHPLSRKYITEMYNDENNKIFDHKYGIRFDPLTETFRIGDSKLEMSKENSDILIKNKRYRGTYGLYELLFKKDPRNYTKEDEANYRQIVLKTNAHKRYYQSNKQIDGSKLKKYKKIIAPIVSGKGIFLENFNKMDYIHWDNPNELVERLRLLLSSTTAGHTGHMNEINSIIEELREANIII